MIFQIVFGVMYLLIGKTDFVGWKTDVSLLPAQCLLREKYGGRQPSSVSPDASHRMSSMMGSRRNGGRLRGICRAANVASFPGATAAPSRAWRAEENSKICTDVSLPGLPCSPHHHE